MKPYPKYKDSGVEWIGKVPEHWRVEKLKWIAKVRLSNIDKKSKEGELAVELCSYVDVYYNDNITSDIEFMKATARQDQIDIFSLKEGDILITKDSESPDDIAVPAYVPLSLHGVVCGYHLAHVSPYRKYANGNYLFWSFSGHGISDQFEISANGVTRFGIGKQAIDNSVFLTPSIEEQTAIAAYLDHKTTQIDDLISKKQKLIELLKEERVAIINQAVTKGLNPDAPMKDSGIKWLGDVPEHWEIKRLKFVSNFKSGNGITADLIKNDGEYAVYGGNGLRGYASSYTHEGAYVLIGRQGALCGNINYADGKFWASEHAVVATLVSDYNLFWFGELLRAMNLNQYSQSAAQPGLSVDHIKNFFIPIPSPNEQDVIAVYLDHKTTKIDQTISKIEKQIDLLQEYRTAIISNVVTGKIDVRDGGSNG